MKGRIRTIKPEALLDEELWDLEEETGLPIFRVFTGLWMYADREGRFEWRPRALQAVIMPYWRGNISEALDALERGRFIRRYEVDGRLYGEVRNFKTHQVINQREAKSTLPDPSNARTCTHVQTRAGTSTDREIIEESDARARTGMHVHARGEGKGRELEGKGREDASTTRDTSLASPPPPDPTQKQPRAGDILGPCPKCGAPIQVKFGQRGIWAPCSNRSCDYKLSEVGRVISIGTAAQPPEVDPEVRRYERLLEAETEAMTRNDWKAVERIRGQLEEYANRARAKAARGGA